MKHAEKWQEFQVRDGALAGWLKPHDGDIHRTGEGKLKFLQWKRMKRWKRTLKKPNKLIKKKGDSLISLTNEDNSAFKKHIRPLISGTTELQLRVTNRRSVTVNEMKVWKVKHSQPLPVQNISIVNKGCWRIKLPAAFGPYTSVNSFLFDCLRCAALV